tara:strand:+ start:166 stop:1455 length:1290 start_codon:yes stop_codon:yes gene_type:complete
MTEANIFVTILEYFNLSITILIIARVIYIRRYEEPGYPWLLFGLIVIYYLGNVILNFLIDKNKESFEKSDTSIISGIWNNNNTASSSNISKQASDKINNIVEETGFNNLYTTPLLYMLNIWVIYRLVSWLQFLTCNNPSNQAKKIKNYSLGITELLNNMPDYFKGGDTFHLDNLYNNTTQNQSEVKLSINRFDTPKFEGEICGMSLKRLYTMIASSFAILSSPFYIITNKFNANNENNKPTYPFSINNEINKKNYDLISKLNEMLKEMLKESPNTTTITLDKKKYYIKSDTWYYNTTCVNDLTYYLFSWALYIFTLFYAISVVCLTGSSRSFGIIGLVVALILMLVLFFGKVINEFVGETFINMHLPEAELVNNELNKINPYGQSSKACDKCTVQGVKIPNKTNAKVLAWISASTNNQKPVINAKVVPE